jgi:hypothetical protein
MLLLDSNKKLVNAPILTNNKIVFHAFESMRILIYTPLITFDEVINGGFDEDNLSR